MSNSVGTSGPRRSGRLATKANASRQLNTEPVPDDMAGFGEGPARKRVKTKSSTESSKNQEQGQIKRRRKLTLSKLVDMPLDVLYETFGHLNPIDLLHLSRTTKALRGVLMNRSSASVWRQARAHVNGLPDCPEDLSEPQYANLVFDAHCHFCLTARVMNPMWQCRSRCCKRCLNEHFVELDDLLEVQLLDSRLASVVPWDFVKSLAYARKTSVDEFLEKRKQLENGIIRKEQAQAYVDRKSAERDLIRSHAYSAVDWSWDQVRLRTLDLEMTKERRRLAIESELRKIGYGGELDMMDFEREVAFLEHPLVKQPKELTPRIWNNIKRKMIEFMEETRRVRIELEIIEAFMKTARAVISIVTEWSSERPRDEFNPSPVDFYAMPEFKAFMTEADPSLPPDELEQLVNDRLGPLAEKWRRSVSRQLLPLIPGYQDAAGAAEDDVDLSPLDLATTWFVCRSCNKEVSFPRILVHKCARCLDPNYTFTGTFESNSQISISLLTDQSPWHMPLRGLEFFMGISLRAQSVVLACGKDPATTTARDMDQLDVRLVCRESACSCGVATVLSWRTAVNHTYAHMEPWQFTLLSEADTGLVKNMQEVLQDFTDCHMWVCLHCTRESTRPARAHEQSVRWHLFEKHSLLDVQRGVDYDVDKDSMYWGYIGSPRKTILPAQLLTEFRK